jgi:oxygen-independent coproporphyrinogen-3 oxidase
VVEFSSEANPGTLTDEKLAILRSAGVNRISLGVQSFDDRALQLLGRIHTGRQAEEAVEHVRSAGFLDVNVDLIQSIPGMSAGAVLDDIRRAVALDVEHISSYNLIYEPSTPLAQDRDAGRVIPPSDEEEADNYFAVRDLLLSAGYEQYEISNFCKLGRACKHNLLYWQGGDYLGCGPSAHSHWKDARFGNLSDLQEYAERLQRNEKPFDAPERLDKAAKARETLVMGLRLLKGVDLSAFEQQTGFSVDSLCGAAVAELVEDQLLSRQNGTLRLTPQSLFISNTIFSALI